LSAAVVTVAPLPVAIIAAAATGLFNAWAWSGIVCAVAGHQPRWRFNPMAPAGVVVLLVLVIGGVAFGFSTHVSDTHKLNRAARAGAANTRGIPVMIVRGFGSRWDGTTPDLFGPGFVERRFSYKGPGEPYQPSDTQQTLGALVDSLGLQVRALSQQTHKPVALVAESEGSLVAKLYLATTPHPPVDQLIMLSPLVDPGRVYYPMRGADTWGVASGWTLRGIARLLGAISPFRVSPDGPLLRDIEDHAPQIQRLLEQPIPGVDEHLIEPLADGVSTPYGLTPEAPVSIVPAFHGGLITDTRVRKAIIAQLGAGYLPSFGAWMRASELIRAASSAWQVPSLAPALNPAWRNVTAV
jgi:hypothetical protein